MKADLLVVGGGPAGMASALAAEAAGVKNILLIEREKRLGGILNQCIHTGFGVELFKQELTGPEFAHRYREKIKKSGISVMTQTTVLSLTNKRKAVLQNESGVIKVSAGAVILATGCRERPRGSINIDGSRPAGVYTAGTAQKLINCKGLLPGRRVVILGSGDIGLIMARRMTLEGARVEAVCELLAHSGGLKRNIVQCLDDFGIPLLLSHTVTRIFGRERVESVEICPVDKDLQPVRGLKKHVECDTLLLSVGLIPENELARSAGIGLDSKTRGPVVNERLETEIPGIFACGNSLHVHDLADYAAREGETSGKNAADFLALRYDRGHL